MTWFSKFTAVLALALLGACGGGSTGGHVTPIECGPIVSRCSGAESSQGMTCAMSAADSWSAQQCMENRSGCFAACDMALDASVP